jgi:hypothetical protein
MKKRNPKPDVEPAEGGDPGGDLRNEQERRDHEREPGQELRKENAPSREERRRAGVSFVRGFSRAFEA